MRFLDGRMDPEEPTSDLRREAIPDLAEFCRAHPRGSVWNWLSIASDIAVAAAFGKLFWPDFVVHEGGIFLREIFSEETYNEWKAQPGITTRDIERVMNHVHIYDLFMNSKGRMPDEGAVFYLAALLAKLWSLRAAEEFGHDRVVVELVDEEAAEGPILILSQI